MKNRKLDTLTFRKAVRLLAEISNAAANEYQDCRSEVKELFDSMNGKNRIEKYSSFSKREQEAFISWERKRDELNRKFLKAVEELPDDQKELLGFRDGKPPKWFDSINRG